jgi:hypothetical protein
MGVQSRHLREVRARRGALLLFFGAVGCLLLAPSALAASRQYPASATRPALRISPSELGHRARKPRPKNSAHSRKKRHKRALPLDAARALAAYEEMQAYYYVKGSGGLYKGEPFAYLWPYSQALAATVSMANIRGITDPGRGVSFGREIHKRLIGLGAYLDTTNSHQPEGTFSSTLAAYDGEVAPPAGPGGPKYYDDNDWVGIELVRLFKLTHEASLLGSAEGIMAFEMAAWETGPHSHVRAGSRSQTNPQTTPVTPSPTLRRLSSESSFTSSPEMLGTSISRRWTTNGCAAACSSRTAFTRTTSTQEERSTPACGATTRGR